MTTEMVLGCVYPLVKDFPDRTINLRLIAVACECSEKDIAPYFRTLVEEGFFKKRFRFLSVYKITDIGLIEAEKAFNHLSK